MPLSWWVSGWLWAQVCTACRGVPSETRSLGPIVEVKRAVELESRRNLAVGARQTMAVMYQSCDVLDKRLYNPWKHGDFEDHIIRIRRGHYNERRIKPGRLKALVSQHYYLKDLEIPDRPECQDVRQTPPIFYYGGRAQYLSGNRINVLVKRPGGASSVTGLDCSGFASVALSAAGLKLRPSVQTPAGNEFTSHQALNFDKHNSCFERVTFEPPATLQPGDLIVFPGHVMIVDLVGPDPFGFERMKQEGTFPRNRSGCYGLNPRPEYLNFSVIQSAGFGDMAAMRIHARHYIRPNRSSEGVVYNRFRDIYEAACLAYFDGKSRFKPRRGSNILRHRNTPECRFDSKNWPRLVGEECTGLCDNALED